MASIDVLSPANVGEDKIVLSLNDATPSPRALQAVIIDIDYSAALPEGITPPVEIIYKSAIDPDAYRSDTFASRLPSAYSFEPRSAGNYLIRIRELGHNRWQGRLQIEVLGDEFSQVDAEERR